jgi:hypothetical protein
MPRDLDTLATALYVTTDELLKSRPELLAPGARRWASNSRSATPS